MNALCAPFSVSSASASFVTSTKRIGTGPNLRCPLFGSLTPSQSGLVGYDVRSPQTDTHRRRLVIQALQPALPRWLSEFHTSGMHDRVLRRALLSRRGRLRLPALVVAADRRKWHVWPMPAKRLAVESGAKAAGRTRRLGRMICFHRDVCTPCWIAEGASGRHRQNQ